MQLNYEHSERLKHFSCYSDFLSHSVQTFFMFVWTETGTKSDSSECWLIQITKDKQVNKQKKPFKQNMVLFWCQFTQFLSAYCKKIHTELVYWLLLAFAKTFVWWWELSEVHWKVLMNMNNNSYLNCIIGSTNDQPIWTQLVGVKFNKTGPFGNNTRDLLRTWKTRAENKAMM